MVNTTLIQSFSKPSPKSTPTKTTKLESEKKPLEEIKINIKQVFLKSVVEDSDCEDRELKKMAAKADIVCVRHQPSTTIHVIDVPSHSTTPLDDSCSSNKSEVKQCELIQYLPMIRSGSFTDIGARRFMEDEHIVIDDLSSHLGTLYKCPTPSAFFGVFDGHGGAAAAAYMKENADNIFFKDADFLQTIEADDVFLEAVENSMRSAFLFADLALADDCTVSGTTGTTAITALILGRLLLIANAGDCRAVLCRKGEAVVLSHDHKPIYEPERSRVEKSGGYIDDGYLNGELSVSRALGDWDMKLPRGSASPLIAEPEISQTLLTEDDEFLIIGCDGIWDVMSSQQAVSLVRRGLRRHDNPEQCARDLAKEALRLKTADNLTVIVVCFSPIYYRESSSQKQPKRSLSVEALCSLKSFLDNKEP